MVNYQGILSKRCTSCRIHKCLFEYANKQGGALGKASRCNTCTSLYYKEYRAINLSSVKESKKNYYHLNKAKTKLYFDNYHQELKAVISNQRKRFRENNKDLIAEQNAIYYKENPDVYAKHRNLRRERQAAVSDSSTEVDREVILNLYEHSCFNCGSNKSLALDHTKPLSAGFKLAYNNCTLLCKACNSSKGSKMPIDFYTAEQLAILRHKFKQEI